MPTDHAVRIVTAVASRLTMPTWTALRTDLTPQ
jgi:hypothetical protein